MMWYTGGHENTYFYSSTHGRRRAPGPGWPAVVRCQILQASARGERAPAIAQHLCCDDQTVRTVIHAFNAQGLTVLQEGKTTWLVIWDNASWHKSKPVRTWLRAHNQQVKQTSTEVRLLHLLVADAKPLAQSD